jgi:hypothetical protein
MIPDVHWLILPNDSFEWWRFNGFPSKESRTNRCARSYLLKQLTLETF